MVYKVIITNEAQNFLNKCDNFLKKNILKKLEKLSQNPKLGKPLTANLAGYWSLRSNKYRILYEIIDKKLVILVLSIGHRKNIYNK